MAPLFTLQIAGDLVQGILPGKFHFKMGFGIVSYSLPKEIVQSVGNVGNAWLFFVGKCQQNMFYEGGVCLSSVFMFQKQIVGMK